MAEILTLKPGLETFREAFNERSDLPRVLIVTSPT